MLQSVLNAQIGWLFVRISHAIVCIVLENHEETSANLANP